jgi:hypothetical protein
MVTYPRWSPGEQEDDAILGGDEWEYVADRGAIVHGAVLDAVDPFVGTTRQRDVRLVGEAVVHDGDAALVLAEDHAAVPGVHVRIRYLVAANLAAEQERDLGSRRVGSGAHLKGEVAPGAIDPDDRGQ